MKSIYDIINEGGMSGHMAHPIDYVEFTMNDLLDLINNLFSGKIEDITEKIDGTNIQATMNTMGEVVFIRNKGDLNSLQGGMSISDMAAKWKDKPSVANTFIKSGETIKKVFEKIGVNFFNPDPETRLIVNCECVIAGKTNIIPYASDQVDFHNIWIYKKQPDQKWDLETTTNKGLDTIENACKGIDGAKLTPKVIISINDESEKLLNKYTKEITKLFDNKNISIDEWRYNRFQKILQRPQYKWLNVDNSTTKILYNRWFNKDKSTNLKVIKMRFPGQETNIAQIDSKEYKNIIDEVISPLDHIFLSLGNDIIRLCKGFINEYNVDYTIKELYKDMANVVKDVNINGSVDTKQKLDKQLSKLKQLGDIINPAEGIVFKYKGRMMKLTGSFAPLNQILGSIKFAR